jgi:hypothetical protein
MGRTLKSVRRTAKRAAPQEPVPAITTEDVLLEELAISDRTQARARLNLAIVEEYAEAMRAGATFPPVVLFTQGDEPYWVADGFHRIKAARPVGFTTIAAEVRPGSQREALLYACAANATHGLPRTNADKRKAVETLLYDPEWRQWSDHAIAKHCGVAVSFVGQRRSALFPENSDDGQRTYVTKHGTVATMDTSRIGARAATTAPTNGTPAGGDHAGPDRLPTADEPTKEALRRGERSIHSVYVELRPPASKDEVTPLDTWLKAVRELCTLIDSVAEAGGVAAIAQRWSPQGQLSLLEELEALATDLTTMVQELRAVCATIDVQAEEG